jgi:hypothetical protein
VTDRLESQIALARRMLAELDRDLSHAPLQAARLGRPTPGQALRIRQELGDLQAERERWATRLAVLEAERERYAAEQEMA